MSLSKVVAGIFAVIGSVVLNLPLVLANEGGAKPPDYSGIAYMYYTAIAIVLAYGVYDTFFKKS